MSLKNKKHLLAISLPIIIISICIFWIVRLELSAAALASRVDDLHNSLKQNKDNLANLESFYREVNKSGITLDKNGGMLYKGDSEIFWDENILQMVNDNIRLEIGNYISSTGTKNGMLINIGDKTGSQVSFHLTKKEVKLLTSEDTEIMMGVSPQKARIHITKEEAKLELGKDKDFHIKLSHDKNRIELVKDKSKIVLGDGSATNTGGVTTPRTGVFLQEVNTGAIGIAKDKGIAIKNIDDNGIEISTRKAFKIELRPKDDQIRLTKDKSKIIIGKINYGEGVLLHREDSQITIGQTQFGEGVTMGNPGVGSMGIVDGKGIAIETHGVGNKMRITGEDKLVITFQGDIDINAYGNLNLNSLNGNVNLVGKRINFNE